MAHISVLTEEVVSSLAPHRDAVVVDCTLGSAGHAAALIAKLDQQGAYIGIDRDPTALEAAQRTLEGVAPKVYLVEGDFRDIAAHVAALGYTEVHCVLADLGWRMEQFDGSSGIPRGFSFQTDEPLHMTYGDPSDYSFTAYDIVNEWPEEDIANVLYGYGEERAARRIARAIVKERDSHGPLKTAQQLAELITRSVPFNSRKRGIHAATKSFQALRIAVNDELAALEELISKSFELLAPNGRLAIISFHSLEDRIVKERFRGLVRDQRAVAVSRKPIQASPEERSENPRARSAKLRVIEKSISP